MDEETKKNGNRMQIQKVRQAFKGKFINSWNDVGMMLEFIRELTSVGGTSSVISAQVLTLARRVEARGTHTSMPDKLKETKECDATRTQKNRAKSETKYTRKNKIQTTQAKIQYCSSSHPPQQCTAYGKM